MGLKGDRIANMSKAWHQDKIGKHGKSRVSLGVYHNVRRSILLLLFLSCVLNEDKISSLHQLLELF